MTESSDPIKKCDRCPHLEQIAEGFRLALLEASKLLRFVLMPTTTDADRAEIYRRAFVDNPEADLAHRKGPPTPPPAP